MNRKRVDPFNIIVNIVMIFICIICMYPFYYMLIYTLSDPMMVRKGVFLFPISLTFQNYINVLRDPTIYLATFISILRTVSGTAITVICCFITGFLVTKKELPFRRVFYRLIVMTMYISSGIIPWYITMVRYGLKNNFLLYILPSAVVPFFIVLMKTYIESISPSLEESAALDGAGLLTIIFKIIGPVSLPIVAAVGVFSAVGQWNAWYDNMMLVSNINLKTLQYTLYEFLQTNNPTIESMKDSAGMAGRVKPTINSIRMTVAMITIIPIFMVYPLLQRYFIKGLLIGSIKG